MHGFMHGFEKAGEESGNEANAYNIMYENYNGIIFMQDVTTSTT